TAREWMAGFDECRPGDLRATLGLGVNNKEDGAEDNGYTAGSQWADLVSRVDTAAPASVDVVGTIDIEPSWSSPDWARAWVDGYTDGTDGMLVNVGAADGCPQWGQAGEGCNNGWSVGDVFDVSTGMSPNIVAVPRVYTPSGTMA